MLAGIEQPVADGAARGKEEVERDPRDPARAGG
jgi:hypothetical protein